MEYVVQKTRRKGEYDVKLRGGGREGDSNKKNIVGKLFKIRPSFCHFH